MGLVFVFRRAGCLTFPHNEMKDTVMGLSRLREVAFVIPENAQKCLPRMHQDPARGTYRAGEAEFDPQVGPQVGPRVRPRERHLGSSVRRRSLTCLWVGQAVLGAFRNV